MAKDVPDTGGPGDVALRIPQINSKSFKAALKQIEAKVQRSNAHAEMEQELASAETFMNIKAKKAFS